MTIYFKAVHPDGGSFYDRSFRWLPKGWRSGDPIPEGWTVEHPNWAPTGGAANYLSVSVSPADCTGMGWPCVLLEVEPVGEVTTPRSNVLRNKRAGAAFRVVRELPATNALGPQGTHVAALIERSSRLTAADIQRLAPTWDTVYTAWSARCAAWVAVEKAARCAAGEAARGATWVAMMDTGWAASWDAAVTAVGDAALALVVRDLITQEHYDALTRQWRTIIGPIHPDDNDFVKD